MVSEMDSASTVVGAVAVWRLAAWIIVTLRSVNFITLFGLKSQVTTVSGATTRPMARPDGLAA